MKENYIENIICIHCGSNNTFWWDGGTVGKSFSKIQWNAYKCRECGKITSDEPDTDLMFTEKYNR
jgi:DNA-directed RNA polymerase subunit RPC12/RpoP